MQLDDLYRRVIMDHYKNPRNRGTFDNDVVTVNLNNPTCGDRISLQLMLNDGIVQEAKYTGEGCSISMSSASMMTEAVKGKTIEQALDLANRFSSLMQGEEVDFDDYEDLEALSGVNKFPARIKCATLAWNALRKGIDEEDNVQ
ncbi:SUF system NifU family Fe-S cluster assembly protein [Paenibacillus polysaccharolyticus]|uniref:SUF system NifU family Fe-S cluster assembly protein n=4 Tax=Paenibacillus TaxID=44249 RepID=A0A5M9WUC8_PAEAM|nr:MULTISPECIES: SUF system NifU family Fe-S cluster assembly protein [Paenibacillus]MDP9698858.1 nitrogen fixation NifU-like protein [Paenibacillus intestini]KAA8785185.1 SUF system NifU family Fe-S cluster assembly protein [Paenibacillus amylolyticus]MBY0201709.1 SUF system NifU family Fe-S cluster assembly protein [Paenibacillus cucumis (ex Kampfer et al. 2016)]MCP1134970.1 SUF system NifU family Fe-S cluster assembly protein [Paenibacillus polysaccharolyticus]MDT0121915.1 SUF system NifU f